MLAEAQPTFTLRGRNPDVLTCITNLSNDEVFTPPEFANRMLDTLSEAWAADHKGANLWADKTVKFLDPCTKSGVFLREVTSRLTQGLADDMPNLEERANHILTKQVFGIGITYLTSLLARRSVYCSKHAQGRHSIGKSFESDAGTSGLSAQSTRGRTANARTAGQARRRWIAEKSSKPTRMLSFIPTTSELGWPSFLEAICSSTLSSAIRLISWTTAATARARRRSTNCSWRRRLTWIALRGVRDAVTLDGRGQGARQVPRADALGQAEAFRIRFVGRHSDAIFGKLTRRARGRKVEHQANAVKDLVSFLPVLAYDGANMTQIDAGGILDIAMAGTSATLLARKWESALLVNVDNDTLRRILDNPEAMAAVERIEGWRALGDNIIETIINKSEKVKELNNKAQDTGLTEKEKKQLSEEEKEYKSKRKLVQEKLIKFATRTSAFMYLTDFRENTLQDVITKLEPDLFLAVTGLTVKDFHLLVHLKVFNTEQMNQAVFAFRRYEDASLRYTGIESHEGLTHYGRYDTVVGRDLPRQAGVSEVAS